MIDKETLIAKLMDLAEGRETPETWRSWWDEHEPELETLLNRGEFLKLKPCRHDFQWVPMLTSQKGAIAILEKSGTVFETSKIYQEQYLAELDAIHSDLLPQYLERAKQDGRSYLLEHAKRIEGGLAMNEKLSRPQFNQMDTTEKQALMESLAARYTMTFLGLHTFDHWGQSCTTGIFEKDGREFVFVPGDTVTLGWERFAVGLNQESREELDYLFREW